MEKTMGANTNCLLTQSAKMEVVTLVSMAGLNFPFPTVGVCVGVGSSILG
jgi:hypothetical protein